MIRRWIWWLGAVLAFLAIWILAENLRPSRSNQQLAKLKAAGYPISLAEVAAWVPTVPEAENLSAVVREAADLVRGPRGNDLPMLGSGSVELVRGRPWTPEMRRDATAFVAGSSNVFARVPELLRRRSGYTPLAYTNGFKLLIPHLAPVKSLTQALAVKAGLDAEEGRAQEATDALRAGLAVARSLDAEPILISQLVRYAVQAIVFSATERALNRVRLTDSDLARLQQDFAERGEVYQLDRSMALELCTGLDVFRRSPAEISAMLNSAGVAGGVPPGPSHGQTVAFSIYASTGLLKADEEAYVDFLTRWIDICRRPSWERFEPAKQWEANLKKAVPQWYKGRILTGMLLPALAKSMERETAQLAQMRCAAAAIAVERHRLAHGGRVPDALNVLVPAYLPAVPKDPYDGKPLRFRARESGFLVYSIGRDLEDNNGKEREKGKSDEHTDVTFILER